MNSPHRYSRALRLGAVTLLAATALSGCGGSAAKTDSSATVSTTTSTGTGGAPAASQVLPVADNPISNAATAKGLQITSVLVENNEDPATKKTVDDHLEIALENTSANDLTGFEVLDLLQGDAETASLPVIIYTSQSLKEEDRRRLGKAVTILRKASIAQPQDRAVLEGALQQVGLSLSRDEERHG